MNILVTIDKSYIIHFVSLLKSIINTNGSDDLNIYIITNDITNKDLEPYKAHFSNVSISIYHFDDSLLKNARTSKRFPKTIYYRLFAPYVLSEDIKRVLYLDSDIIINGSLKSLYNMDFDGSYFIASTNVGKLLLKFNSFKNGAPKNSMYINTGAMLINLEALRINSKEDLVYRFIKKRKLIMTLPDQDVVNGLYGDKIKLVDGLVYNLSDRKITFHNLFSKSKIDNKWVNDNAIIIHYYGRNKPWKKRYRGILKGYYLKYKI